MQTAIVAIIVALAAIYLVRRFYKSVQSSRTPGCAGGCSGCSQIRDNTCSEPENRKEPT
jgi:hypothetical protein